nr:HlyD family secretion protein [Luteibacter sp. Sphag1AF]
MIGSAVALAAAIAGVLYFWSHDESRASSQTTDDAYVTADWTRLSPRVAGVIDEVLVEDNERVAQGELLATIDDRDFKVAVNEARARVASASAALLSVDAQREQQENIIAQAAATVSADGAALRLAEENAKRYKNLASDGSGTAQEEQAADAHRQIQSATQSKDSAALGAATKQQLILTAQRAQAAAELERAQANLDQAELRLSYTRIVAPVDGTVGQRDIRVGQYVNVGSPVLTLVPLHQTYVEAHFRETQLARIRPKQAVDIRIDSLPGVSLRGHVASIAPATGVSFAPFAPDNATGNFTKVVQRLTVKIALEPEQAATAQLRVGMSAIPTVSTPSGQSL